MFRVYGIEQVAKNYICVTINTAAYISCVVYPNGVREFKSHLPLSDHLVHEKLYIHRYVHTANAHVNLLLVLQYSWGLCQAGTRERLCNI